MQPVARSREMASRDPTADSRALAAGVCRARCGARESPRGRQAPPSQRAAAIPPPARGSSVHFSTPSFADELPADQKAADFAGAGADIIEFCVPQAALYRPFLGISSTAQRLYAFEAHTHRILRREQYRTS